MPCREVTTAEMSRPGDGDVPRYEVCGESMSEDGGVKVYCDGHIGVRGLFWEKVCFDPAGRSKKRKKTHVKVNYSAIERSQE